MTDRLALRAAVLSAAQARMWTCDDGHKHRRPEVFTMNRLKDEVNRRNPRNGWYGAEMACAAFDLIESGELEYDPIKTLSLRVAA